MMRRQEQEPADEPLLFDLPLEPERDRTASPPRPPERKRTRPAPTVMPEPEPEPDLGAILDETDPGLLARRGETDEPDRAGVGSRLAAGAADLLVHGAVIVGVLLGCRSMGVRPMLSDWPGFALFLLSFSFLYTVVPLAFWGHTPGMAWRGLDARSRDGEPLAFDQTARRWLGGIVTSLLLGLPLVLALGGRSLSDLLSGSETLSQRSVA
ncbi:MAG: RDD family protein [Acidobacteriota bacterium]